MGILSRKIYKQIEWYLYNYYEIKREVQELKDEIIEGRSYDISEWGGGISYHSDPTANRAIKLTRPELVEKEKWLKVIEKVVQHFQDTEKGRLLQKKYFDELGEKHICEELYIERATYYNWRNEIVLYAALLAVQEGLLKV